MEKSQKALLSVFLLYSAVVLLTVSASLLLCSGKFIYVLDDPYIHMTIARNFVESGHWATNGMNFSSASSSPVWTLLISLVYWIFGQSVLTPLLLNFLFGIVSIILLNRLLLKYCDDKLRFIAMLLFVFAAPLPAILFTGMEHILQITLTLFLVFESSEILSSEEKNWKATMSVLVSAVLLCGTRYEGVFVVLPLVILFILRKKFVAGALLLISGALPIVVFGMISVNNGWYFLPNTLLIKSKIPDLNFNGFLHFGYGAVKNILEPHIFVIFLAAVILLIRNFKNRVNFWSTKQIVLSVFISVLVLHETFAQNGWFFRYEAYVVALGITSIAVNSSGWLPALSSLVNGSAGKKAMVVIAMLPLIVRSFTVFLVPLSSKNIYEQHYQMAQFVNTLPSNSVIAANDIGMLNFYTRNRIIDLWGLSDLEAGKHRIEKTYDTQVISNLCKLKDVDAAVVYKPWFMQFGGLPDHWNEIGAWEMTDYNIVCGNVKVTFFCLKQESNATIQQYFREYCSILPKGVKATIY